MKTYKNILLINYGGIGDEILFLPTIKGVKEDFKNAKITLALEERSRAIKQLTNLIDDLIYVDIKASGFKKYLNILKFVFKIRKQKFDCVISSGKSPFVAIILFLSGIKERIGYNSKTGFLLTKKVELNQNQYAGKMYHDLAKPIVKSEYHDPQIEILEDFKLDETLSGGYIALHPGVSRMSIMKNIFKCPEISFWNNLIEGILEKNKKVLLLGTKDDEIIINEILKNEKITKNPNFINYFQKTKNIMEMAFLMKNSSSVICVDSAPLHVAVSVGAKVFAIFGPTNEEKLVPKNENIKIIKNDIPCRPCLWDKRQVNCEKSDCLKIDVNKILNEIWF